MHSIARGEQRDASEGSFRELRSAGGFLRSLGPFLAGTPTLERWRSVQLIWFRAVEIAVSLTYLAGDQGTLVAHGDQGSGYGLYVRDGRKAHPVYCPLVARDAKSPAREYRK